LRRVKKYLLITMMLSILMVSISSASAWKNGSYGYNREDYSYEDDYGTHDWIAEAALEILLTEAKDSWTWLADENLKIIYLLGTEAPDNSQLKTTLDMDEVEGFGDTTKHHVYFDENDEILEDDSALRAKKCADLADVYLEENKREKAAFYLGAMTHYIADLAMYAHVAENNVDPYNVDFDEWHSKVEGYVNSRTNDYEDQEEFFEIDDDFDIEEKKAYDAATDLAWDTYADPDPSESITRDAKWLHDNFFTDWADNKEDREDESTTRQLYYDRIEESLNNAIKQIVLAMVYVGGAKDSLPSYNVYIVLFISFMGFIGLTIKQFNNTRRLKA